MKNKLFSTKLERKIKELSGRLQAVEKCIWIKMFILLEPIIPLGIPRNGRAGWFLVIIRVRRFLEELKFFSLKALIYKHQFQKINGFSQIFQT